MARTPVCKFNQLFASGAALPGRAADDMRGKRSNFDATPWSLCTIIFSNETPCSPFHQAENWSTTG
jgi:hypothetical protein